MTTRIEEAEDWAKQMTDHPMCYDEEHDVDIGLPANPTTSQVVSALDATRVQINLALMPMIEELKATQKELDKMRNHRHDNSKQFGGRPEL